MSQNIENERILTRYLLGDLSEEEKKKVEDEYFSNDSFFEDAITVEEDLIDSYLRGQLSGYERERFETQYLSSPARRERVEFARTMAKAFSRPLAPAQVSQPQPLSLKQSFGASWHAQNRALRLSFGLAALLLAVGVSWLLFESIRLRSLVNDMREERADLRQQQQELAQQVAEQRASNEQLIKTVESSRQEQLQPQSVQDSERAIKQGNQLDELTVELYQARAERLSLRKQVQESLRQLAQLRARNDRLGTLLALQEAKLNQIKSSSFPVIGQNFTSEMIKLGQTEPVILAVKLARDNIEPQKVQISRVRNRLLLQINLEADTHPRYRISIHTTAGESVLAQTDLKSQTTPSGRSLQIDVPTSSLTNQKYLLTLEGLTARNEYEPIAIYSFEIVKK